MRNTTLFGLLISLLLGLQFTESCAVTVHQQLLQAIDELNRAHVSKQVLSVGGLQRLLVGLRPQLSTILAQLGPKGSERLLWLLRELSFQTRYSSVEQLAFLQYLQEAGNIFKTVAQIPAVFEIALFWSTIQMHLGPFTLGTPSKICHHQELKFLFFNLLRIIINLQPLKTQLPISCLETATVDCRDRHGEPFQVLQHNFTLVEALWDYYNLKISLTQFINQVLACIDEAGARTSPALCLADILDRSLPSACGIQVLYVAQD